MTNSDQHPDASTAAQRLTALLFGFMTSQAIAVAARLGISDLLKHGPRTAEDLARATGTHAPSLHRLLRALASEGIFAEEAGTFRMTPLAEPLASDAKDSLRAFAAYMGEDWHWEVWSRLPYSVRTGRPAFEEIHGRGFFEWLPRNAAAARVFHDAMTSFSGSAAGAIVEAYDFSRLRTLVDVGGGHGLLLTEVLRRNPGLSGIVFDAPSVVAGAGDRIASLGLDARCKTIAGDFFESVPSGADAYIMKHIIHDWDDDESVAILGNCRRASEKGARVLIVEMVLPDDDSRSTGKWLDLEMLLFLHSHERTAKQYFELLERAGLQPARVVPTRSPYSIVEGIVA